MKRISSIITAAILCLCLCIPAFATEGNLAQSFIAENEPNIIFSIGKPENVLMPKVCSQQLYYETVNGSTRYIGGFSCNEANGSEMEFTVENTGSTDINVHLTYDGEAVPDYTVSAGDTRSTTATNTTGEGLTGDFNFTLSTGTSEGMSCTIYAEQK